MLRPSREECRPDCPELLCMSSQDAEQAQKMVQSKLLGPGREGQLQSCQSLCDTSRRVHLLQRVAEHLSLVAKSNVDLPIAAAQRMYRTSKVANQPRQQSKAPLSLHLVLHLDLNHFPRWLKSAMLCSWTLWQLNVNFFEVQRSQLAVCRDQSTRKTNGS